MGGCDCTSSCGCASSESCTCVSSFFFLYHQRYLSRYSRFIVMMMMLITLPLCRRSRRLEISYHTNYQRLVLGDGDDAVMERRGSGEEEVVVVMEERKETDYSPMLENARLEVKWFAMQMTFDIHLLYHLSAQDMFLFLLLMMMMMIFSPLCSYAHVLVKLVSCA